MKVDPETVKKVLAIFDPEDIPYIQSDALLALIEPEDDDIGDVDKKKVKRQGEVNDRCRK